MKSIKKVFLAVLALAGCMCFWHPLDVQAAAPVFTASVPGKADAGMQIAVKVSVSDNPGLTTLGLRLGYDEQVLSFQKEAWTSGLCDGNNRLTLVSDVTYAGAKVLNISMVDSSVYRENGTMVTLYFNVRKAYSQPPVTLMFRDATDGGERRVSGTTRVVSSADAGDITDGDDPGGDGDDDGNDDGMPDDGGRDIGDAGDYPADGGDPSLDPSTDGDGSTSRNGYDKSFRTGGFVWTPVLSGVCVIFSGAAMACGIYQRRLKKHGRREIQDIIGSKED